MTNSVIVTKIIEFKGQSLQLTCVSPISSGRPGGAMAQLIFQRIVKPEK